MASFPRTDSEIAALALMLVEGLKQAPEDFPNPPVAPSKLQAALDAFDAATSAVVAAKAVVSEKQAAKAEARDILVDRMKADLRYAEVAVRDRPEQLTQVGWGSRRPGTKLAPPGEVRDIAIKAEGDTWIVLAWKPPVDGGGVAAYVVERRRSDGGSFEYIATVVATEHRAVDQPRGIEFDYRVVALNRAGRGAASGMVTAVL
jgi:hypothetical protein